MYELHLVNGDQFPLYVARVSRVPGRRDDLMYIRKPGGRRHYDGKIRTFATLRDVSKYLHQQRKSNDYVIVYRHTSLRERCEVLRCYVHDLVAGLNQMSDRG